MTIEILSVLSGVMGAVVLLLLFWVITLERRLGNLLRGGSGKSLESVITGLINDFSSLDKSKSDIESHLKDIERRLRRSIQHVKTIRFNPFSTTGSNQSFVTALVDEDGNGVVISSIYSRDKVSVYAKPIKNRASEHKLSSEEIQALKQEDV